MSRHIITAKGKVISKADQSAIPGLKVEVWDKDLIFDDLVGESITTDEGYFEITFTGKYFQELFFDRKPDLYFKILRDSELLHSTEDHILWNVAETDIDVTIEINEPGVKPAQKQSRFEISGNVTHTNGNNVQGIGVRVSKKLFKTSESLKETKTDADGNYSLSFTLSLHNEAIIIQVLDADSKVLASSDVIFRPLSKISQDFTIDDNNYKGLTLFQQYRQILQSYLEAAGTNPFSDDDIRFIAGITQLDINEINNWLSANTLAITTGITAEALYGFFTEGVTSTVDGITLIDVTAIPALLKQASDDNAISTDILKNVAAIIQSWKSFAGRQTFNEKIPGTDASVGNIINLAIADETMQAKILDAYINKQGTTADFWNNLKNVTGSQATVDKLQTTLQLATLAGFQPEVTSALLDEVNKSGSILSIAQWDVKDWTDYIAKLSASAEKSVVPPFIQDDTEAARVNSYATIMAQTMAMAHPTQAFLGQLTKDAPATSAFGRTDMVNFINNNSFFDLTKTPTFGLKSNDQTLNFNGVKDRAALISDLQSAQRLFVYTKDYNAINTLKNDGISSAKNIVQLTSGEFVSKYAGVLGSAQNALQVHSQAQQHHLRTLNFYLYMRENLNPIITPQPDPFNIINGGGQIAVAENDTISIPDLRTMFGSLDTCACEECTSAYSAAAYFADILNFLKNANGGAAYAALTNRRPDLLTIELNCANTNTVLPYVDLAIELMENYVLAHTDPAFVAPGYQTTWQPEELAANPEHLNPKAYIPLTTAVYPYVLPFDFFLEESRVYLQHLGIKREELMKVFFHGTNYDAFKAPLIAYERLLLSPGEAKIINGDTKGLPGGGTWNFYGFDLQVNYHLPLVDPATTQHNLDNTINWDDALTGRIDVLLQQTGLSYIDLLALLNCNFINPLIDSTKADRKIAIVQTIFKDSDNNDISQDTCELQYLGLRQYQEPVAASVVYDQPVEASFFEHTHRFIRLWKKLGWKMYELDLVINNDIDLLRISQIEYLCKQWRLPVDATVALWGGIGTTNYIDYYQDNNIPIPSLYQQLFVNSTISGSPAFPSNPADVAALGVELTDSKYLPTILAAFQVNETDFDYLIQYLKNEVRSDFANTLITINNLSVLYRFISLANQLGYSMKEFLTLKSLLGIDPFADDITVVPAIYTPFNTFKFLQKTDIASKSGFSVYHLNYLLYHIIDVETPIAPQDADISTFLLQLLTSVLPLLQASGNDIFNAIKADTKAVQDAQNQLNAENAKASPDPKAVNSDQVVLDTANVQLNTDLVQLNKLRNTIIQKFSEKLKISATAANILMGQTLVSKKFGAGSFLVDDFLDPDFLVADFIAPNSAKTITRGAIAVLPANYSFPNSLFDDYMQLDKLAAVINQLKLTDDQLLYILKNAANLGCLDLTTIPPIVYPGAALKPSGAIFDKFETLVKLIQARNLLTSPKRNIFDILNFAISATDQNAWTDSLVANTGWDSSAVKIIIGYPASPGIPASPGLLNAKFPADYTNGDIILKIRNGLSVLKKVSCSADVITALIQGPDVAASTAVKNAAKVKYNNTQWKKIAKPLRDVLREKQREALLAYLISHPDPASTGFNWKNADDVYGCLLTDMEMKPINLTSRIKQAICSVQLFIDRVLLNLESGLSLLFENVNEWKQWRCLYRVWEANRMVLFYPENWIDYTLLDLKSPFYKEMETELAQDELTADNIEDLFNNYLEKLDEVARLEVTGLYHQVENQGTPDSTDIWHIFGRTPSHPHKFFHRTLENGLFNPWVKLNIDIDGDHMVPIVFNRRLCLFWFFFTKKTEQSALTIPGSGGGTLTQNPKYWQIQVAWSEFKHNKWTPKKLSKQFFTCPTVPIDDSLMDAYKEQTSIRAHLDNDKLHILVETQDHEYFYEFVFQTLNDDPQLLTDQAKPYTNALNILYYQTITSANYVHDSPSNTDLMNMMYTERSNNDILEIAPGTTRNPGVASATSLTLFDQTPNGIFKLVPPSDEPTQFSGPFMYQDAVNSFYVEQYLPPNIVNSNELELSPALLATLLSQLYPVKMAMSTHVPKVLLAHQNALANNDLTIHKVGHPKKKKPSKAKVIGVRSVTRNRFTFHTFYDPYVKTFIKEANKNGVKGLLKRNVQGQADAVNFSNYAPNLGIVFPPVIEPDNALPAGNVEVGFTWTRPGGIGDAYAQYHWELFFYIPMRVSYALFLNQQFDDARNWVEYVFNPTNSENNSIQRFWQFLPFWDEAGQTGAMNTLEQLLKKEADINAQIQVYMTDPFQPHAIGRLRITAYMKNVVMKYLDIIIAKADNLFRSDTIERINEAANLYVLALKILGDKPQKIPARAAHQDYTVGELLGAPGLNGLTDPLINIDTFIAPSAAGTSGSGSGAIPGAGGSAGDMFYFCIPGNDYILQYWNTVADRLFKIRNSMNIEGIVRTLPLFEPPIDPALLVRAAAAGIDLNSLLNDISTSATPGNYRFTFIQQKALEVCNEVKALGSSLLQALEKRDAEAIALLRSAQEQQLLQAVLMIKQNQLDDAQIMLDNANKALEMATYKQKYYSNRPYINTYEQQYLNSIKTGITLTIAQGATNLIGSVLAQIPDIKLGVPTTDGETYGGSNLNNLMSLMSNYLGTIASVNSAQGSMAATMGGYDRRRDDWNFQAQLAQLEIDSANNSILSAQIKLAIAQKDLDNQQLQIDNAASIDDFLHNKFSNQELYDWMVGQISSVYFQSYQLAYDISKKAEACYKYELGPTSNSPSLPFIKFGYWDSLKKGLFAAEKLAFDLKQMEDSYYEKNVREFELTKHISIAQLDPLALLTFKQTGECMIDLPEEVFDVDYPGHYFRRIKSLSVTIPCITGPYTTLSCTLTLTRSSVRIDPSSALPYGRVAGSDTRFSDDSSIVTQSIALSHGQNDSGLFDVNFRDERYLPFENAGVISSWYLQLSSAFSQFDYSTISDAIFHLKYAARDGGLDFQKIAKDSVTSNMLDSTNPKEQIFVRLLSLKQDFPNNFYQLLNPSTGNPQQTTLSLGLNNFPYYDNKAINIVKMAGSLGQVFIKPKPGVAIDAGTIVNNVPLDPQFDLPQNTGTDIDVIKGMDFTIKKLSAITSTNNLQVPVTIPLLAGTNAIALDKSVLEDVFIALNYKIG